MSFNGNTTLLCINRTQFLSLLQYGWIQFVSKWFQYIFLCFQRRRKRRRGKIFLLWKNLKYKVSCRVSTLDVSQFWKNNLFQIVFSHHKYFFFSHIICIYHTGERWITFTDNNIRNRTSVFRQSIDSLMKYGREGEDFPI